MFIFHLPHPRMKANPLYTNGKIAHIRQGPKEKNLKRAEIRDEPRDSQLGANRSGTRNPFPSQPVDGNNTPLSSWLFSRLSPVTPLSLPVRTQGNLIRASTPKHLVTPKTGRRLHTRKMIAPSCGTDTYTNKRNVTVRQPTNRCVTPLASMQSRFPTIQLGPTAPHTCGTTNTGRHNHGTHRRGCNALGGYSKAPLSESRPFSSF
ncbi:hypothetical protein B0H63DRAFT_460924 [Podospora didyma]|uniref:Uncharacterized protein n=1 Tax=Podospora didyma TaxID=330526 RepID=A0AAE0P6Z3_9PEZI|nr:hypothetical protein B0H63DRAFT_460924 [Podospora didyma]